MSDEATAPPLVGITTPSLPPFIDVAAAIELRDSMNDVVVCDCRAYLDDRNGIDAYHAGHIPGARFIDLETVVSGPVQPGTGLGRHPLPNPEEFAADLGQAGIGHDTTVIAYDDAGGAIAARFVWMLRRLGQRAAVLDGSLGAWSGELETDVPSFEPVAHEPRTIPKSALASLADVEAALASGDRVVDSRAASRFAGVEEPIDTMAGHIPKAINLPFAENLEDGELRPINELAARFAGSDVNDESIFYCGSGVTACHNLLAVEAAGVGTARLYVGSWSGWIDRPEPPVATGQMAL